MLLPYLHLPGEDRIRIVAQEELEGMPVWSEISTTSNGHPTKVQASRKWGVVMLGGEPLALEQYPLAELTSIQFGPAGGSNPIYEQHKITANYRCKLATDERLAFEPVQREHPLGDGRVTELVDIGVILSDEIEKNMGLVSVGDVKEFTLNVQVLAGFQAPPTSASAHSSP